jgi:hypothetical protein
VYISDINSCSNEIKMEFNLSKVESKDFESLVNDTVDQYWCLLAEALEITKGDRKQDLIRVLEALHHFKSSSEVNSEKFDESMKAINFGEA